MEPYIRLKKYLLCVVLSVLAASGQAQQEALLYEDGSVSCAYTLNNKRMNGSYVSYYRNGVKKAEGTFQDNCRVGVWSVWDSTDRLRMQRDYTNLFEYKQLFPVVSADPPVALLNNSVYELTYNENNYIDYFKVQERMVIWSQRIWRMITPKENPKLFEEDAFHKVLTKNIDSFYVSEDETFAKKLTDFPEPNNYKVISYKLKEDTFFDNERFVSESRILGICPVAIDLKTKDTVDLYWVYFPKARSIFAKERVKQNASDFYEEIRTFDDLFFFRDFYGAIYKESNVYDKSVSDYTSSPEERAKESQRIEISLIETEHDYWMRFAR